jgi:hypothetical protein
MSTKQMNQYLVTNNGISHNMTFSATDADEALMYAYRYERFLRICAKYPNIPQVEALELAKNEEIPIPHFNIEHCIVVEAETEETGDS